MFEQAQAFEGEKKKRWCAHGVLSPAANHSNTSQLCSAHVRGKEQIVLSSESVHMLT